MTSRDDWFIICIGGVTCGGKTTLAKKLKSLLTPVYVFHQDKYFYPDDSPNHVKCDGINHNNYDILSALDMDTMYNDIMKTMNGDNKAHSFNIDYIVGKIEIPGKKIMILDGFTVLSYTPIMEISDLRYFLVLEYGECASRRSLRLYDPPDIPGYFETCVWPEHLRCRVEMEKDVRVTFLDGREPDNFDYVIADLKEKGARSIVHKA